MALELLLLIISALFFVSILASKAGYRLGIPALLLFLAVGMIFGSDGLGVQFENIMVAQTIGTISLCIILFSGGMDTKISDIRPVIAQGLVLSTFGVLFTAAFTGLFIWWILGLTLPGATLGLTASFLLASTMSSTDSASVFSILRAKGLFLKNNLRPTLELESGSNDPMAYVLTITLISIIQQGAMPNYWGAVGMVFMQLIIGSLVGYGLSKAMVFLINRINVNNVSLYPILVLTFCIFIFSITYFLKGNSYLAVYIGGLVIGNAKLVHKRSTRNFFDGLSWLSQLTVFLTLGLLVNPSELIDIAVPGLIISFVMILVTRPLSVYLSLTPFRKISFRDKTFISWVGLRGAVPIIFAITTMAANVPQNRLIFNIVFFCTLISLVIQGTTLPLMARWLKVAERPKKDKLAVDFDIDFPEEMKSETAELEVTEKILEKGNYLMDLRMSEKSLVIMIKRGNQFFVPTGKTILKVGDKLLILADNQVAMIETYQKLGVEGYEQLGHS